MSALWLALAGVLGALAGSGGTILTLWWCQRTADPLPLSRRLEPGEQPSAGVRGTHEAHYAPFRAGEGRRLH